MRRCALLLIAPLLLAAGGSRSPDWSILYSGVSGPPSPHAAHPRRVTDAQASANARSALEQWLSAIRKHAEDSAFSDEHFASPATSEFLVRLNQAAHSYGFIVRQVTMRHPRQLAPEVVIESDDFVRLSHALGPIENAIDPSDPARTNDREYEAIFIEAVDSRGIPYSIVSNALRGQIEGSQWARADALYPFLHL